MVCVELQPDQRLDGLDQQPHCRGFAYVISDRLTRKHVVLTHRLPRAHKFLSDQYEDSPCLASLYEAATARIRSGLHHRRWRVLRVPLEEASNEFERERRAGSYEHPIVLAQRPDQLRLIKAA